MNGDRASAGPSSARSSYDSSSEAAEQLERLKRALTDRYMIESELGHGGTANVYRARDLRRGTLVALKVLRPELSAAFGAARFAREVEIGQRLDHPNILRVIDSGEAGGDLYYTMPLVDGSTLRARLRAERQLPIDDAVSIVRQVAAALAYAHAQGVIHRDITPANILFDGDHTLVADLGIARAMTVLSGEKITGSGISLGTPEYMSPEQATGEQWIDGRTDIYSLGCVLYESLAGEPPFTGPSAQAIVARHCQDSPRSLRVIRPSIPPGLERVVMKALSKVPADRFSSAAAMIEALDTIDLNEPANTAPVRGRRRVQLATSTAVVAALAGWLVMRAPGIVLDPRHVAVFPLRDLSGGASDASDAAGEGVATYIGYALDGTPLKWREGIELMSGRDPRASQLTGADARMLSLHAGAGYFIDGTILRRRDSTIVFLKLHDTRGDSVIKVASAIGPSPAFLPELGLRAVADLLPPILEPGRKVDLRALSERAPAAIANFLQGEHEYRHMQFRAALDHYAAAVGDDSAFALAAFRGAQAATWLSETDTTLLDVALRRPQFLLPSQVLLARGLRAYLTGAADSAVSYLQRAVTADSTVAGAWALLGEVSARTLAVAASDSLTLSSLRRARQLDADFSPALLLLEELALQSGDIPEMLRMREALRRAGADTTHAATRGLIFQCVRAGPSATNWIDAARRDAASTIDAARELSRRMSFPACAAAAFRAVIQTDTTSLQRWARGGLLGLQGLLIASNRAAELPPLLASKGAATLSAWQLYVAGAVVGAGFERQADAASDSVGRQLQRADAQTAWLIAGWAARKRDWAQFRRVVRRAHDVADSSGSRRDALVVRLLDARLPLADADTETAIERLRALRPTGARRNIAWTPLEGLGAERLLLAELLLAKGRYEESITVASLLDATEPVPYLLYLRPSLVLRVRAATALGDTRRADRYEERLHGLEYR